MDNDIHFTLRKTGAQPIGSTTTRWSAPIVTEELETVGRAVSMLAAMAPVVMECDATSSTNAVRDGSAIA